MKRLLKLFRLLNKNNSMMPADGKSKLDSNTSSILLVGILLVGGLGYFSYKYASYIDLLDGVNTIFLLMGMMIAALILIFGFMSLINNMYMSSDIEILITLPFSATQIAVLRVLSFFRIALVATVFLMAAPFVGYFLVYPFSISVWVAVILTGILLCVFMTSVTALLVILVMTFLKIFHSRQALKVVGSCFLFIALCSYLFLTSNGDQVNAFSAISSMANMVEVMKYSIPVVGCAVSFIETGNVLYPILEIVCTVIASALFFVVAKYFYLKGAMNMQDAGRGKLLTGSDIDRYSRKNAIMKSLIAKEYRTVRRNPVYLLNNFIVGALWPIIIVIAFKQIIPLLAEIMSDGSVREFSSSISAEGFIIFTVVLSCIILIIVSIPLSTQNIAYSSLSREGNSFQIMKQLPIPYKTQIRAKRTVASRISQISATGYSILIFIVVSILLKVNFLYCIVPLILVALYTELHVNVDMLFGIHYTNVNWDDEKEASKKPFNARLVGVAEMVLMIAMGGGFGYGILFGDLDIVTCFGIIILLGVLMAVANLILYRRILNAGEKKIRRLRF